MTHAPGIHPQMLAAQARNDEIVRALGKPAEGPDGLRQLTARARDWWNEGGPTMASSFAATVPGPERAIPVQVYVPSQADALRPAFIYFHGGGWRIGSPTSNDRQLRELAAAWGGIVVSADYAHLPEKRFPSPVLEAAAVYDWLARHGAQWGVDGSRLACGGTSAGANVAMGALHAASATARRSLRAAACMAGVYDDDLDTGSMQQYGDAGMLPSRSSARAAFTDYAGADRGDPRFNILQQEPTQWPPLFLAAAEVDVYRDSSVRLAERARDAGGSVDLRIYQGMTHLFFGYSRMVDGTRQCIDDLAGFLRRQLPVNGQPDSNQ